MQMSKLIALIAKIFLYSAAASFTVFFIAVYISSALVTMFLPANMHVEPTFYGSLQYALYNSIELSIFFTTFILLVIKLSVYNGVIFTIRDIIRYYKRFIIATAITIITLCCVLSVVVLNVYKNNIAYLNNVLISGEVLTYVLPFFWFILAAIYYRGYQSKITEPDGSKDRSWLEGNIES